MTRRKSLTSRDERGFTLPEMLLAIVIGGLVTAALVSGFVVFLRTQGTTTNRLALSHDRQFSNSFLSQDIQSAGGLATDVLTTGIPGGCYTGTGTAKLYLHWTTAGTPAVDQKVVYAIEPMSGGTALQLVRVACGADNSTKVIARNLSTTGAQTFVKAVNGTTGVVTVDASLTDNDPVANGFTFTATVRATLPNPTTTVAGPIATTTTTAVSNCQLSAVPTATPSTVNLASNGKLSTSVVVTVKTSGSCSGLFIEYSPSSTTKTIALTSPGPSSFNATIPADNTKWDAGMHSIVVKTSTGSVLAPTSLNTLMIEVDN